MREILHAVRRAALFYLKDSFFEDKGEQILNKKSEFGVLNEALSLWSQDNKTPVVLFIDEVDSLVGDILISLLRQLRSGYNMRPAVFPQSIILCGVREGYLLIFDRTPGVSWEEKIFKQEKVFKDVKITVYGM